jgi:hypothetical protein
MNKHLSPRPIFLLLAALTLIAVTFACGGGSAATPSGGGAAQNTAEPAPGNAESTQMVIAPTAEATSVAPEVPTAQPAVINETRRLTLEFPPKMRAGVDTEVVILTLDVDDLGNITPTAQFEGNVVTGDVIQVPDLYDTHNITAEARLDLAGVVVTPPESTFEPLKRGQPVKFYWSIRPQEPGKYRGTAWLHLNFENRSTGEKDRVPVSAQIVEIEAVDFFGLSANVARTGGVIGSVVGTVIGFPFLEDIVKFLFGRRKKKQSGPAT